MSTSPDSTRELIEGTELTPDPSATLAVVPAEPGSLGTDRPSFADRLAGAARSAEEGMLARQLRRVLWLFVALWFASFAVDAVAILGSPRIRWMAVELARVVPIVPLVAIARVAIGRQRVGIEQAQRLLVATDVSVAIWLSILSLATGGIDSPYQTTVMFVSLTLAIVPMPWRRGLVRHLLVGVVYISTMVLGHVYLARIELKPSDDPWLFLMHAMLNHAMSACMVVVSHTLWSLRQEVFTARNVGRYELRRLLGRGGMGEVWAAYHTTLRREVALKLVRVDDASAVDAAARFEREVLAMTRLSHPNTVRIYDFGAEEGGLLYCAMELLEGEDLGAIVRREGPLPFARTRRLLLQASSALAEAHELGIVHRDIKPENLFVMRIPGGREMLKVLDFGIAHVVGQTDDRLTHRGAIAGTPATLSPESIEGKDVTPASDVYSLGCVAYFMLAGHMPFGSKRTAAVLNAHLHEPPVPPSVRAGEPIPLALEAIVMRCLAKDPARRFANAGELAAALSSADLASLSSGPRMSTMPPEDDRASDEPAMVTSPGRTRRPGAEAE